MNQIVKTISRTFEIEGLFVPGSKRTQRWLSGLGSAGVFPYTANGLTVWHYKNPAVFLADEFISQYSDAIVTNGHPWLFEDTGHSAVGLSQNPRRDGDLIMGDVVVFHPGTLLEINDESLREISPGIIAELVPIDREIMGVRCSFEQIKPSLDHVALVPRGRQGESVALQRILDSADTFENTIHVENPDFLKPRIEIMSTTTPQATDASVETLGLLTAKNSELEQTVFSMTSELAALRQELAEKLEIIDSAASEGQEQDLTEQAKQIAVSAVRVMDSAKAAGVVADIETAITNPTQILRAIVDSVSGEIEVADADLPAFVRGIETARANTKLAALKQPAPVATVIADEIDAAPAASPIKDAIDKTSLVAVVNPLTQLAKADRGLFSRHEA